MKKLITKAFIFSFFFSICLQSKPIDKEAVYKQAKQLGTPPKIEWPADLQQFDVYTPNNLKILATLSPLACNPHDSEVFIAALDNLAPLINNFWNEVFGFLDFKLQEASQARKFSSDCPAFSTKGHLVYWEFMTHFPALRFDLIFAIVDTHTNKEPLEPQIKSLIENFMLVFSYWLWKYLNDPSRALPERAPDLPHDLAGLEGAVFPARLISYPDTPPTSPFGTPPSRSTTPGPPNSAPPSPEKRPVGPPRCARQETLPLGAPGAGVWV